MSDMNQGVDTAPERVEQSRAMALKLATRELHEQIDARMMAAKLFDDRERYGRFLRLQHAFHWLTEALYRDAELNRWLPGLAERERFSAVDQDCRDLGVVVPAPPAAKLAPPMDASERARALGWLYVNEGSNLGAAFLYKYAASLGLDGEFGARHLAPHPEGRGLHWRQFAAQIDAAPIEPEHEEAVILGAREAFETVLKLGETLRDDA
ncbi:biliverdin-producing heme oxygenase [Halotalea alkalilenta]|uniref:biliverdin-producing heme oxygenase n=1 Tax=Halotalea alkalilenta TaxID=376489 RepID=UPI000A87FC26|nr:biliverdin-producing heme oxygenase [Halotalea alkalilenta]